MLNSSDLQSFVPKDNVSLNLGKTTIYVYPHISEEMSNNEKAYSFLVNKLSLESAGVKPQSQATVLQRPYGNHVTGRNSPSTSC
jgi:hypothetical protein